MGCCLSKRGTVHPLSSSPCPISPPHLSPGNKDEDLPREVYPTIPETFYPSYVIIDDRCRLTKNKIAAQESGKAVRCAISEMIEQWRENDLLERVENSSLSIPPRCATSVESLARSFSDIANRYSKSVENSTEPTYGIDVCKAYLVFFWICNNISFSKKMWEDSLTVENNDTQNLLASQVLGKRKCTAKEYAELFHILMFTMDMKSCVVTGNLKPSCSQSHNTSSSAYESCSANRHWWNMFSIEGVWMLVDCTCGSGMIAPYLEYHHRFVPQYFAVDPEYFILSHVPTNPNSQLLQNAVPVESLIPLISPSILSLSVGVKPLLWTEFIKIDENSPNIIKVPIRVPHNIILSASLRNTTVKTKPDQNEELSEQQRIFITSEDGDTIIYALVPNYGQFFLDIFAHIRKSLILCYSHCIQASAKPLSNTGFPKVYDAIAKSLNFKILYWNTPQPANVCENNLGELDIVFKCDSGTFFHHFLTVNSQKLDSTEKHHYLTAVTKDDIDTSLCKLNVLFPSTGWWTIHLCAVKAHKGCISGYTTLLNYTVWVTKEIRGCSYPYIHSPNVTFKLENPISCTGKQMLHVPFFLNSRLNLNCTLYSADCLNDQHETYCMIQTFNDDKVCQYVLKAVFPAPGKWYIDVFSKAHNKLHTQSLFELYFDVEHCLSNVLFPFMNNDMMSAYNIQLLHPNHLISKDNLNKRVVLNFRAPKLIEYDHYIEQVSQSIGDNTEAIFQRYYTFLKCNNDTADTYSLTSLFPKPGKWNIILSARKISQSDFDNILRVPILIPNDQDKTHVVFPNIAYSTQVEFRIEFQADKIPHARLCTSPEFQLLFHSVKSVNYAWSLTHVGSNKQIQHSNNAFIHRRNHKTCTERESHLLRVVFPKSGTWMIEVFCRHVLKDIVSENSLSLNLHYQPAFNVIIEATNATMNHMGFPMIYDSFFTDFGLQIHESDLPIPLVLYGIPAKCSIRYYSPSGVLFWHRCTESSHQKQEHQISTMTSHAESGLHELCSSINEYGQWTLELHAKLQENVSQAWTAVLHHTFYVHHM